MSSITVIQESDLITGSRTVINTNFANLNNDKMEASILDTDSTLGANSDAKVPSQKAVKTYVDAGGNADNLTRFMPTGVCLPYGGSVAPSGYLLCNGAAVSRSTYAALFAAIGTSFGIGDGSSTFNLPDGRNRTFIGAGSGTRVATFASRSSNVLTVTGLTNAANNEFQTGQAVVYHTTGNVITGLSNDATYYLVRTGNLTFSLATSLANAQNGTVITLSSDGTGVQTFTLTFTTRAVGDMGGEENHAISSTEMLAHSHTASSVWTRTGGTLTETGGASTSGTVTTSSFGGNVAMNNLSPFFAGNWIIKT